MANLEQRLEIRMPSHELENWKHYARVAGVPLAEWVRHHVRRSLDESNVQELFRELRAALQLAEHAGRTINGWNFTYEEENILRGATRAEVGESVISMLIVEGPRKAFERIYGIPVVEWRAGNRGYQS